MNNCAEPLGAVVRAMADSMLHRGPDDVGTWCDPEAGLALGHRRLSIIDLSQFGHQPMESADGRYVIVLNGEIYNYRALRAELMAEGQRFHGQSDTEVLIEACARWGLAEALRRSNGMFAVALYDRAARILALARDRMGQKPLYYGWAGRAFAFASELKAFRTIPGYVGEIDRGALVGFLRHGYVPAPHCIYRGVYKLPPGTLVEIPLADIAKRSLASPCPYWSISAAVANGLAHPLVLDAEEAEAQLDAVLREAVGACMVSDVPVGAFLSGGIDSSAVVALMQAQSASRVRTFTIGFRERGFDEAAHAAAVARHLSTDHTQLYVDDTQARDIVPALSQMYDEPFADSSQIPTALIARLARRSVTVALSGDGGDELFGGYNRYVWGRRVEAFRRSAPRALRQATAMAMRAVPIASWDALLNGWAVPGRIRLPQAGDKLHKLANVLDAAEPGEIYRRIVSLNPDPAALVPGGDECPTFIGNSRAWPDLPFTEQMMFLDSVGYLPDDILVKLDRASMAASLESRVPLLDHRVVEFAWRLPPAFRLHGGTGKWLLRRVLARYVPATLTERPKMGFGVPIGSWLRGPLRDWAECLLAEDRLSEGGLLDPAPIRRRWAEHLSGRRNWQYALWCVLMFQAWYERWR